MKTKLFFSKGAADKYIRENHAGENSTKSSITDRTDYEEMANIPDFSGELEAVEFDEETVAWFHLPIDDDEIAMMNQLGALGVRLRGQEDLHDGAVFALADIEDENELTRDLPVVYYQEGDNFTFFTPWDWQGWLPESSDEIEDADWRVLDTDSKAVMINGLPRALAD